MFFLDYGKFWSAMKKRNEFLMKMREMNMVIGE